MSHVHVSGYDTPDFPDVGEGMCCYGAAMFGPHRCTCWDEVYDLEQQPPDPKYQRWLNAGITLTVRDGMCLDCAYRPNSPERSGDTTYLGGNPGELDDIARGREFMCHEGMRRVLKWVHRKTGDEYPAHPGSYRPPFVPSGELDIPYKADGTPGDVCAGWNARHKALLAADAKELEREEGLVPETSAHDL